MAGVPNMRGEGAGPPRLLAGLCLITVLAPPEHSRGPKGDGPSVLGAIKAAGYEAVQGRDPQGARAAGLVPTAIGRLDRPADARPMVQAHKAAGCNALTLHVGTGFERDDEALALAAAAVDAAVAEDFPVYVETHRATITQDMRRTLDLVERLPELRFNGDFSHWYTGAEMTYGDLDAKLSRLEPVLARTRFIHGRVSSPGVIQVPSHEGRDDAHLDVFRRMWTWAFEGFLAEAKAGDVFGFYPELLPPSFHYARLVPDGQGGWVEEGDRWAEALFLVEVARECWAATEAKVREPAHV